MFYIACYLSIAVRTITGLTLASYMYLYGSFISGRNIKNILNLQRKPVEGLCVPVWINTLLVLLKT
jgi:hypothetical protein